MAGRINGRLARTGRARFRARSRKVALFATALLASSMLMASFAASAPAFSLGLMWSGVISQSQSPSEWNVIQNSGATTYRIGLSRGESFNGTIWSRYDPIFEQAWKHGITILPALGGGNPSTPNAFPVASEFAEWNGFAKRAVERYGVNGTFWQGKANPKPVTAWEVWNEPNLPENNPPISAKECAQIEQTYNETTKTCAQPAKYGEFLVSAAAAIRAQQSAQGGAATILFGGLFASKGGNYLNFLRTASGVAGALAAYDGVSDHPYTSGPAGNEAGLLTELENEITGVRNELNAIGGTAKSIWVTEFGWPVEHGEMTHPAVNEIEQANLLAKSVQWMKALASADNIQAAYYYNVRDSEFIQNNWAYRCGLLKENEGEEGEYRPSWFVFQEEAGVPFSSAQTAAVHAGTGALSTWETPGGATNRGFGMAAGTSPSIDPLGAGKGYAVAFQTNTSQLWTWTSTGGAVNTLLGMAPGTSPSLSGGGLVGNYVVAVQANNSQLLTWTPSAGAVNTLLGMAPGTSPSVAMRPLGSYVVALQANNSQLLTWTPSAGAVNTLFGMAPGTSPSVAVLTNGTPVVAFQANTGQLWISTPSGPINTLLGMAPGTSPSITALSNGSYAVAIQANTTQLLTWTPSGGAANQLLGMAPGTSPSIASLQHGGGYAAAIQGNTGQLFSWTSTAGGQNQMVAMEAGTSPSIESGVPR